MSLNSWLVSLRALAFGSGRSARFPQCAEGLRRQLDFHAAVEEAGPTVNRSEKAPGEAAATLTTGPLRAREPALPRELYGASMPSLPGFEVLEELGRGAM